MESWILSRYIAILVQGTIATIAPCSGAFALSYAYLSPEQVTDSTDVWVHGRVVSATGPEVRKNDFGDSFRDITLKLEILKSTDVSILSMITVRSETSFHHGLVPGQEVFAALARNDDGTFRPYSQLGLYGWIHVSGNVDTRAGPVSPALYWRWLCGIRYAADTNGQAKDEDLTFWEQSLTSSDPATTTLALDFFKNLDVSPLPADQVFGIFLAEYDRVEAETPEYQQVQYPANQRLQALATTVARALSSHDANVVAKLVLDFCEHGATRDQFWRQFDFLDQLLPLVQRATDPAVLSRLPEVYDNCIRPEYTAFTLLPTAPSEALDAWLWDVALNPQAHKVGDDHTLAGVWRAMANRKDKNLAAYLKKILAGTEVPAVTLREPMSLKYSATDVLIELEQNTLTREARLAEWVQRIKQNDTSVISRLAWEITPDDRFLIPDLATITTAQWSASNHSPSYEPAATIMKRLHDPAFVPILLEWTRTAPEPSLLEALAACGDAETAIKRAIPAMNAIIPASDSRTFFESVQRKFELLLFLGNQRDPSLGKLIIPFTEDDRLDGLARQEISLAAHLRQENPFNVWQLRDSALLALAKSGHPDAVKTLQASYKTGDIRVRCVAAFALYALGAETGHELVDVYRRHEERSVPEIKERWRVDFAGGNIYRMAVVYLDSPKLDQLYFERVNQKFDNEDHGIATHPDFVDRHRTKIFDLLIARIDDPKNGVNLKIAQCLEKITSQKFGEINGETPLAERVAMAQRWKDYVASLPRD